MKYSPFDGSLDRVIEELLEQNKTLKLQLDLATQELARMDDRLALSKKQKEDEDDKYIPVTIGAYVRRVGYGGGELTYTEKNQKFFLRESAVLTEAQVQDDDFEYEESEETTYKESSPEQTIVYHQALDCDGNE